MLKKLFYLLYAILLICIIFNMMNYLLVDDSNQMTRLTFHELYHQSENIDILFLGSSHCFRSINPQILEEMTEKNTFNAGTSAQYLDGSYAILKEAGRMNHLETVYIEMYYGQIGLTPEKRGNTTSIYIISDFMRPSWNKVSYLLQATDETHYVNSFFPARRNIENIFDWYQIKKNIEHKNTDSYKNFAYIVRKNECYAGNGFVNSFLSVEENTYGHLNGFYEPLDFSDYDLDNLDKILQYCKNHNIEVVLFSAPMSNFRIASLEDYDAYVQQLNVWCKEHDVQYYDFNLCKEEYLDLDESCFIDDNHLNGIGAERLTTLIGNIENNAVDVNDIFYSSYLDKLNANPPTVYGTILEKMEGDYHIHTIQNKAIDDLSYSIFKIVDDHTSVIGIHTTELDFSLPTDEHGIINIITYENDKIVNNTNINY